jgi:hypothetical protein
VRFAIALACLLVTTSASADENRTFVRLGAGVGRFRARQPEAGDSVLGSITQTGFALEASVGANVRKFSVALTLLEHIVTFTDDDWKATHPLRDDATSFTLVTLGPSLDYHLREHGGPYFGALIGLASFANRTDDRPLGFGVAAHGGWDVPVGVGGSNVGLGLRLYYASMGTDALGRAQVFSPTLMVHYAYR